MNATRRSLAYSIADSYLALPLQIVGTMILSRVLTPAQIGVFAVATVFASLASNFRDFGVAEYLIQEKELTERKIRAALMVNIIVSWAMGLTLYFLAPTIADFYKEPGVATVMQLQAFNFLLIPFGAVTMAHFRRELDFQPIFVSSLLANITTFTVATACAYNGLGHMSLAWSSLAGVAVTVAVAMWFRPKGFPRWPSFNGVGHVFDFGKFASGIYVFGQLGKGAPEMIIGRVQDMVGVAQFSRAGGLIELFQRTVMRAVHPICMPYFAMKNREQKGVNAAYLKGVSYITVIGWPFFAFLGIAAYSAVRVIYGTQWVAIVPMAQILCVAGAVELVHSLAKEMLLAVGDVKRSNYLQMGLQAARILGVLAIVPFGLYGVCWGLLVSSLFGLAFSQWHLGIKVGLTFHEVFKSCVPSAWITFISIAPFAIWVWFEGISESNFMFMGVAGGIATGLLWLASLRWLKHPIWTELQQMAMVVATKLRKANS